MNAAELLGELEGTSLKLTVIEGGKLKVQPRDKITDISRSQIKENKDELIRLVLKGRPVNQISEPSSADESQIGRSWTPGNPFICACGSPTGWTTDGITLCPTCNYDQLHCPKTQQDQSGDQCA